MSDRERDRRYYDSIYGGFADSLNAAIRVEAFGEEIGQNSWLTADEHRHFFTLMDLDATSAVREGQWIRWAGVVRGHRNRL